MNGMTHKQAMKWIDRRQDGLLKENQQSLLDEHLRSCDSCRHYSEEMVLLGTRLSHEFQARWDEDPGPSKKVFENVNAKAKDIPAAKRASSGLRLVSGLTVLVILGIVINFLVAQLKNSSLIANGTQPVSSFPVAEERLLAFASNQSGNSEIYTMHADGSGLTNLTNDPAYDGFPSWSPDGKQIAFESDRDGSSQIYIMDANGSNVIQLTHGGDANGFLGGNIRTPWSPDGRKLIFSQAVAGDDKHLFYVLDIATKNMIPLTKETGKFYSPAWSPDGEHIAFILDETQGNNPILRRLYVVDSRGNQLTNLTEGLPDYETVSFGDYYWSSDGTFITFVTESQAGTYKSTVYQARPNGSRDLVTQTNQRILDWWNGVTLQQDLIQTVDETSWSLIHVDRSQSTLGTCQSIDRLPGPAIKRSTTGRLVFGFNCSTSGWTLYRINPEGTVINDILGSPLDKKYERLAQMSWSPDDQFLAFVALDAEDLNLADLYVLNAKYPSPHPLKLVNSSSPSWQPDLNNGTAEETPTPEPTQTFSYDGLIAFMSEQSGNQDIYTLRADGSQLTNLTNNSAKDYSPIWAPDGQKILFASERTGNEDIFVMDADGSNPFQLTDNAGYDGVFFWSPNGEKIIYTAATKDLNEDGQLVLMDANGNNKSILTEPGSYFFLGWSPDGQKIVYLKQNTKTDKPLDDIVVVMNIDGTDYHEWNLAIEKIKWEDDQHFVGYGSDGQENPSWSLRRFSTNGDPPVVLASHSNPILGILKDTHIVGGGSILAWYTSDGSPAPITSWNSIEVCRGVGDQYIPTAWTSTAPDESKTMIVIPCQSGTTWFYVNPLDGSEIRKLTDFFLDGVKGGFDWSWSPDGKYSVMTISSPDAGQGADLYLFDIEQMLRDPSVQPTRLPLDKATKNGVVWQPYP